MVSFKNFCDNNGELVVWKSSGVRGGAGAVETFFARGHDTSSKMGKRNFDG